MPTYKVLVDGKIVESGIPGKYAGHRGYKIFGTLDCASGKRMKKENRVFFLDLEGAVSQGYRPCKLCRPLTSVSEFLKIRHLTPFETPEEFYDSGRQFKKKT
jgi:hypothetical protein